MTPVVTPLERRKMWTVEEVERWTDMGAFGEQKFELLEGDLIEKMPQNEPHFNAVLLMQYKLFSLFGQGFLVLVQLPMNLESSKPEPDLAVVTGVPRGRIEIPTTALLVVEISDSTLLTDQTTKSHIYARAQIAEYWIINLHARQIEVRRAPTKLRRWAGLTARFRRSVQTTKSRRGLFLNRISPLRMCCLENKTHRLSQWVFI